MAGDEDAEDRVVRHKRFRGSGDGASSSEDEMKDGVKEEEEEEEVDEEELVRRREVCCFLFSVGCFATCSVFRGTNIFCFRLSISSDTCFFLRF